MGGVQAAGRYFTQFTKAHSQQITGINFSIGLLTFVHVLTTDKKDRRTWKKLIGQRKERLTLTVEKRNGRFCVGVFLRR